MGAHFYSIVKTHVVLATARHSDLDWRCCGSHGCSVARPRAVAIAFGSRMSVAGTSAAVAMGAMYSSRFMESIFSVSDSLHINWTLVSDVRNHDIFTARKDAFCILQTRSAGGCSLHEVDTKLHVTFSPSQQMQQVSKCYEPAAI